MLTSADQRPPRAASSTTGRVKMPTRGSRGWRRIRSASGGSTASASAGRPSVARLTYRICTARQRHRQPRDHGAGQQDDLADVARQQIHQVLLDVAEDDAAFLDRRDDGREVVVEQRHAGGFLADVGAGDAHRDADVGLLQRRRVVDAVAGHRHDVPRFCQAVTTRSLSAGETRAYTAMSATSRFEIRVAHRLEIAAGDRPARPRASRAPRRSALAVSGWSPVIITARMPAASQVCTAARASARGGSIIATRPSSVISGFRVRERRAGFLRDREHPQAVAGHALFDRADRARDPDSRQRHVAPVATAGCATRQHVLGGALRVRHDDAGRRRR